MMIVLFALVTAAWAQEMCDSSMSADDVYSLLKQSEAAFQKMDTKEFANKRNEALESLPCVRDRLTASHIAQLHRIEVLYAFTQRDMAAVGGHVRAAAKANPDIPVVQGLVQSGHPLDVLSSFAVQEVSAPPLSIPRPILGAVWIDGKEVLFAPPDLPYVFQLVKPNGEVSQTVFVDLGDPLPMYSTWKGEAFIFQLEPRLTMAATGFAAAALGTATWAYFQEQKFWNPATSDDQLETLKKRTNQLTIGSLVLGTTSAGLLITAGITGSW